MSKITCNNCNKEFSTKYNLTVHLKTSKTCGNIDENGSVCMICNKKFYRALYLKRHQEVCKQKPSINIINQTNSNNNTLSFNKHIINKNNQYIQIFIDNKKPLRESKIMNVIQNVRTKDIRRGVESLINHLFKEGAFRNIIWANKTNNTLLYKFKDKNGKTQLIQDIKSNKLINLFTDVCLQYLPPIEVTNALNEMRHFIRQYDDEEKNLQQAKYIREISNLTEGSLNSHTKNKITDCILQHAFTDENIRQLEGTALNLVEEESDEDNSNEEDEIVQKELYIGRRFREISKNSGQYNIIEDLLPESEIIFDSESE